ncbi:unnamed protein product, partial [marine sediment metagenome]
VSTIAGKVSAVAPAPFNAFLALVSVLAGALPPILIALTQFQAKIKMKKAILAKADQIDKIIVATKGNPTPGDAPILDFLKADMRVASGDRLKELNTFDAVRKGVM